MKKAALLEYEPSFREFAIMHYDYDYGHYNKFKFIKWLVQSHVEDLFLIKKLELVLSSIEKSIRVNDFDMQYNYFLNLMTISKKNNSPNTFSLMKNTINSIFDTIINYVSSFEQCEKIYDILQEDDKYLVSTKNKDKFISKFSYYMINQANLIEDYKMIIELINKIKNEKIRKHKLNELNTSTIEYYINSDCNFNKKIEMVFYYYSRLSYIEKGTLEEIYTVFSQYLENLTSIDEFKKTYVNFLNSLKNKDSFIDLKKIYYEKLISFLIKNVTSVDEYDKIIDLYNCSNIYNYEMEIQLDILNSWMATSYFYGKNGASKNIDKAIEYNKKIINEEFYLKELSNDIYKLVLELINIDKDYNKANEYLKFITRDERYEYISSIINEKLTYDDFLIKAKNGDLRAKIEVAKCCFLGIGTEKNIKIALKLFDKIIVECKSRLNQKKPSDVMFFALELMSLLDDDNEFINNLLNFFIDNNKDNIFYYHIIELVKHSLLNNVYIPTKAYELYLVNNDKPYATQHYDFLQANKCYYIDCTNNIIYYLQDYYKKSIYDVYSYNEHIKHGYLLNIAVKNGNYYSYVNENRIINTYDIQLKKFINKLDGKWNVCFAPGHDPLKVSHGSLEDIVDKAKLPADKFSMCDIIKRTQKVDPKHIDQNRKNDYIHDMLSMKLIMNPTGKNWLIIDDITTSGATLIACRNLLLNCGADEVICLALAKTK